MADKTDKTFDQYVEWIRNEVPFLDFAPVVSISAKTGQRVGRVLEAAVDIWGERRKRVSTGELNRVVPRAAERQLPPVVKGRRPKIFYATQAAVAPPTFVFFANDAGSVHFSYRRYLENRLRDTFGFDGTPIRLVFRDRERGQAAAPQEAGRGTRAATGVGPTVDRLPDDGRAHRRTRIDPSAIKPATKREGGTGKKSGPKPGLTRGIRPSADRERRTP